MEPTWKSYEDVACYLLNQFKKEFGLANVEGKQTLKGHRSGTKWKIEAKGVREGHQGFMIVECRRYTTSKQNQEKLGGLAYRISDTGAAGGIIVSPLGLQEGALKVARSENIISVQLHPDSTPNDFSMQFLNHLMLGLHESVHVTDTVFVELIRNCCHFPQA